MKLYVELVKLYVYSYFETVHIYIMYIATVNYMYTVPGNSLFVLYSITVHTVHIDPWKVYIQLCIYVQSYIIILLILTS